MNEAWPAKDGEPKQGTLIDKVASHRNAMTLGEFAEIFSISYKTVFEWASQGRLPAFQIGCTWRLDPFKVANWVRGRSNATVNGLEHFSSNEARSSCSTRGRLDRKKTSTQAGQRKIASRNNEMPRTLTEIIAGRRAPLTLRDFAKLFNLSYKTTWELASQGRIPATRVGSTWCLELTALTKWLGERESAVARRS